MSNGKNDDGSSAPTRIREVRPANKPEAKRESSEAPRAPMAEPGLGGGASAPTQIRGYSGGQPQDSMKGAMEKDTGGFDPVVGWLVITEGPGRGKAVNIFAGMNSVGRGAGQRIRIDFGDQSISGEGACFITFEPKRRTFHITHGGKANIVYLNDEAVLTPMPLSGGQVIALGETKLRFVPLCGPDFNWE
jgi:hypothetical protein